MRKALAIPLVALGAVAGLAAACGDDPPTEEHSSFDAGPDVAVTSPDAAIATDAEAGASDAGEDATVIVPPSDGGLPAPELLATVPGLLDFDFEGTTLVYQTAVAAGGVGKCTVPGCTDGAAIPAVAPSGAAGVAVAGGQVYFPTIAGANAEIVRTALDGTGRTIVATTNGLGTPTVESMFGGSANASLVARVTLFQGRYEYRQLFATPAATRTDRAGRATHAYHQNLDAQIYYKPLDVPAGARPASFTGTRSAGAFTLPLPPAAPDLVAVSPTIVDAVVLVKSPIAVHVRAGAVYACPIPAAGNCGAWVTTGVNGARAIAVDDEYLYVGLATGIGRCPLSDAATSKCAPSPVVVDGPIDGPMYVGAKDLWYRVGTKVYRVRVGP